MSPRQQRLSREPQTPHQVAVAANITSPNTRVHIHVCMYIYTCICASGGGSLNYQCTVCINIAVQIGGYVL